ncbi:uncharacterized protein UHOD_11063 [Ustilago sp. UG-2017b]|nr:uncharacterized protein UHOD_11063 [Ustilago sp. UG-2017b]
MASSILLVLLLFFSLCGSSSLTQSCSSGSWSLVLLFVLSSYVLCHHQQW